MPVTKFFLPVLVSAAVLLRSGGPLPAAIGQTSYANTLPLIPAASAQAQPSPANCGRGLVPKDAESTGREGNPLLDFNCK
jgi:hypothetical protein